MKKVAINKKGFAIIEIIIALAVVGVISGATYYVFKDEIHHKATTTNTTPNNESKPTPNPFPAKPTVSAAGNWNGNFTVQNPTACAGQTGGWQATLKDTDGTITGDYSAANGAFSGAVTGTVTSATASFNVANASGVISFKGNISGNTISGGFTGVSCSGQSTNDLTTGTFFGGRTVNQ
jgi:prepilin-type N-terminal cleavage/methylation domain-containing protein